MSQNDERGRQHFGAGHNSQHMTPEDRRALYDREIALYLERRLDRISREEVAKLSGVDRLKAFTEGYLLASIQYCRENWKADCAPTVLMIISIVAEASKGGFCSISLERFGALLQRKPDTVSAAIDRLVRLGAIEVERRPGASTVIRPLLPRLSVPIDMRQIVAGIFAISPPRAASDVAPRGRRREGAATLGANGTRPAVPDGDPNSPPVNPSPVGDSPTVEQGGVVNSPPVDPPTAPRSARDDLSLSDLSFLMGDDPARLFDHEEGRLGEDQSQRTDGMSVPEQLLKDLVALQSEEARFRYEGSTELSAELHLIAQQQPLELLQARALVIAVVSRIVRRGKPITRNLVEYLRKAVAKEVGKHAAARREGARAVEARQGTVHRFAENEQLANVGGQAMKGRHGNMLIDRVPGATTASVRVAMEAMKVTGRNISVDEVLKAVERKLQAPLSPRPLMSAADPFAQDIHAFERARRSRRTSGGDGEGTEGAG